MAGILRRGIGQHRVREIPPTRRDVAGSATMTRRQPWVIWARLCSNIRLLILHDSVHRHTLLLHSKVHDSPCIQTEEFFFLEARFWGWLRRERSDQKSGDGYRTTKGNAQVSGLGFYGATMLDLSFGNGRNVTKMPRKVRDRSARQRPIRSTRNESVTPTFF